MSGTSLSGRRPKSEDLQMIEKLTPLDEMAFQKLKEGLDSGDFKYLRLWFLYRFGKPREQKDINITSNQETPLFEIIYKSNEQIELDNNNKLNKYDGQN
jgi:hypothetical protein